MDYLIKDFLVKVTNEQEVFVGEFYHGKIYYDERRNEYYTYDGLLCSGSRKTIKEVLEHIVERNYYYEEDEETLGIAKCQNCGDGGCLYCEPKRFL